MKLPVGTRVVMSERGKEKWTYSFNNPHNIVGTVVTFHEEDYEAGLAQFLDGSYGEDEYFLFAVDWDNKTHNSYRYGDLDPAADLSDKSLEDYL